MKLETLCDVMRKYNGEVAYGSECAAWQDFVSNCVDSFDDAPWSDKLAEMEVPDTFRFYWLDVANGWSLDYVAETGDRSEDYNEHAPRTTQRGPANPGPHS